jgi:hypothetical protein
VKCGLVKVNGGYVVDPAVLHHAPPCNAPHPYAPAAFGNC